MKYGALLFIVLMLVQAGCSSERPGPPPSPELRVGTQEGNSPTISLGMDREAAVSIIKACGGQDLTGNLSVVGPNGEWPLSGIFWELKGYDSVLEITAEGGKVSEIGYWTGADFSVSKEHRLRSRRSLKSLSFDRIRRE